MTTVLSVLLLLAAWLSAASVWLAFGSHDYLAALFFLVLLIGITVVLHADREEEDDEDLARVADSVVASTSSRTASELGGVR